MTPTVHPRERGFFFLYLLIQACRPRSLLWQLHVREDVDYRRSFTDPGDGGSLFGVCSSMRANKVLGRNSDHQSLLCFSILWSGPGFVTLGRVCGGQRHPDPFFHLPFYGPFYRGGHGGGAYFFPTYDGKK